MQEDTHNYVSLCTHPSHNEVSDESIHNYGPEAESILNPCAIFTSPLQILISNPLGLVDTALCLGRWSTLLQLVPEMQPLVTSKQQGCSPIVAVDILAAVRRVDPLARSSAVAFSWALEGDRSVSVGWVWERNALGRRRGLRDPLHRSDSDGGCAGAGAGSSESAVREGDEQGGMEDTEDGEEDAWLEVSQLALGRHVELRNDGIGVQRIDCLKGSWDNWILQKIDCLKGSRDN